jgi:hypothetical protein
VDPEVAAHLREVRFRKTFGGSHEDFMNQPMDTTAWMLEIDRIETQVQNGQ